MGIPRLRLSLYALFALSGFSGLIYESIWTHYLKLFLGHAAYAQTLVLSIFMGGMAIGAWLAGAWSTRVRSPLLAYAGIEAVLGVMALLFDPMFRGLEAWAFDHVIPGLASSGSIDLFKWGLSAAVILPQSVLLGATFPLMSAGVVRFSGERPGEVLAWLYFANSGGAAIGVLASGFVLISAVGLPGTILAAGLLNFALVAALLLLLRSQPGSRAAPATQPARGPGPAPALLLAAAFFTGAASFFYEIGWIRMLSLVLGSATHSFEFMLSAFILGLALGSFLLRRRIDTVQSPWRLLAGIQVAMAVLALLTLVVYGATFDVMAAVLDTVRQNDRGYVLFNVFSHLICLALMLPVTICAGMTLPLITRILLTGRTGEAAIGRVYAANTIGSICGVLVAVHWVMPLLGLRQVIVVGAAIDLLLGLCLLWPVRRELRLPALVATAAALVVAVGVVALVRFDPSRLASGVYRTGSARMDAKVVFHRDGKTASVNVFEDGDVRFIATNGKVDAALRPGPRATGDDFTMIQLAALPAMMHRDLQHVAVVGFGSGRTTHALLQGGISRVDTIEIEPAMIEGARAFGDMVSAAYDDPRSHVHVEDAKTFFSRGRAQYDAIISEPSNPWVSGVASLFSQEFYRQAKRHLRPDGLLVQWLQLYEFDIALAASVLKALASEFPDYTIYLTDSTNVVVVASPGPAVPEPTWNAWARDGMGGLLPLIHIFGLQDLQARKVGDRRTLQPFFEQLAVPANSDYYPFVDQHAAKQRFLHATASELIALRRVATRMGPAAAPLGDVAMTLATVEQHEAQVVGRSFTAAALAPDASLGPDGGATLLWLGAFQNACGAAAQQAWLERFQVDAMRLLPFVSAPDASRIARGLRAARCHGSAPDVVKQWIEFFEAVGTRDWPRSRQLGRALMQEAERDSALGQFLLAEVLLADLASGQLREAAAWLPELQAGAAVSPETKLLTAHLAAALAHANQR
jgi:spermidine synthase